MNKYFRFLRKKLAQRQFIKPGKIELQEATVSFTFDDVPGPGFENGVHILSNYGFAGTFYVALCFLGTGKEGISFQSNHLASAMENQHEIGCHTFGHLEFYESNYEASIQDISRNQKELGRLIPGYKMQNFSYPFGHQTTAARRIVHSRFNSGRGNENGLNVGQADLNNLKAVRLYEEKYPKEEIYQIINYAVEKKAWLIFYTHDIQETYSKFGCSPTFFESTVRKCFDEKVKVLPVREALQLIRPT